MAWILDLDGVLWLGDEPIPGSADAVASLRDRGERVGEDHVFRDLEIEAIELVGDPFTQVLDVVEQEPGRTHIEDAAFSDEASRIRSTGTHRRRSD